MFHLAKFIGVGKVSQPGKKSSCFSGSQYISLFHKGQACSKSIYCDVVLTAMLERVHSKFEFVNRLPLFFIQSSLIATLLQSAEGFIKRYKFS